MPTNIPTLRFRHWRSSGPSVSEIFARPDGIPLRPIRRRQERFRRWLKVQIPAQIHKHQAVAVRRSEESQDKGFRAQHSAMYPVRALRREYWVLAADFQEILVQCQPMRIALTIGVIEFAAFKRRSILRAACDEFAVRVHDARKLIEKIGAALLNQRRKLFVVVGKI